MKPNSCASKLSKVSSFRLYVGHPVLFIKRPSLVCASSAILTTLKTMSDPRALELSVSWQGVCVCGLFCCATNWMVAHTGAVSEQPSVKFSSALKNSA